MSTDKKNEIINLYNIFAYFNKNLSRLRTLIRVVDPGVWSRPDPVVKIWSDPDPSKNELFSQYLLTKIIIQY